MTPSKLAEDYLRKVRQRFKAHGIKIVEQKGSQFTVMLETGEKDLDETFHIHIPILRPGHRLMYGAYASPDTVLGVMEREVQKGGILKPQESLMFARNGQLEQLNAYRGGWYTKYKTTVAEGRARVDNAFYCRLSEAIIVELERGLRADRARMQRPGFIGFTTTNGSILNLLTKYSILGLQRQQERIVWSHRVIYNVPYREEDKSTLIDLSAVPQDTNAVTQALLCNGVDVSNGILIRKKSGDMISHVSRLNSGIPLINYMTAKRLVPNRARYQALTPEKREAPMVKSAGGFDVPGTNALTVRSDVAPPDSFIVSESLAKRMKAVEEVTLSYTIPHGVPVDYAFQMPEKQEVALSKNLGLLKNKIQRNSVLFTYYKPEADGVPNTAEELLSAMNNKKAVNVRASLSMYPVEVERDDNCFAQLPISMIKIRGYRVVSLKVGSKLMDRYGNKGTVCKVVQDQMMPEVEMPDGSHRNAEIIYSPSIWKKKIGLPMKMEELLSLRVMMDEEAAQIKVPNEMPLRDEDGGLLDETADIPRLLNVKMKDGWTKLPVGGHYIHHLNQDPVSKFRDGRAKNGEKHSENGCRLTFIDKIHYSRLGVKNLSGDYSEARSIARALDLDIRTTQAPQLASSSENETVDAYLSKDKHQELDVPVLVESQHKPAEEECIEITKRMNRANMRGELHTIPRDQLEGTVCDPVFWDNPTQYGYIKTIFGTVYVPPGLTEPIAGHDNSLVIGKELILANAILAEQISINRMTEIRSNAQEAVDMGRNAHEWLAKTISRIEFSKTRLKSHIQSYKTMLAERMCAAISDSYFPRLPGISAVAVANNKLALDEIGIPEYYYKKMFSKNPFVFARRHPIHRVYNTPVMKAVPIKDRNVIQMHTDTLAMMDGDSDGDLLEVCHCTIPAEKAVRYLPTRLMKGRDTIEGKKKIAREGISGKLGWSQHDLKLYTALAGTIARRLADRSMVRGYGFSVVSQVYHFPAQTALNAKHNRHDVKFSLIQDMLRHLSEEQFDADAAYDTIVQFMGWNSQDSISIRRRRLLKGLLSCKPPIEMALMQKKVKLSTLHEIVGDTIDRKSVNLDDIQSADLKSMTTYA